MSARILRIIEQNLEAPPGFEPGVEVLQTSALPLGDGAVRVGLFARKYRYRRDFADTVFAGCFK